MGEQLNCNPQEPCPCGEGDLYMGKGPLYREGALYMGKGTFILGRDLEQVFSTFQSKQKI